MDWEKLPSRYDIVSEAVNKCLSCMFREGYPSMNWEEELEKMEKDPSLRKRKLFEMCYLPQKVYEDICERFKEAYRISPELKETVEILKQYFQKPIVEKYLPDPYDKEHTRRTAVIEEAMPEEHRKVAEEYLDKATEFFRWDSDEQMFTFNVMNYSPSCNRETVEKYWHENGRPDLKIPEDSYWDDEEEEMEEEV